MATPPQWVSLRYVEAQCCVASNDYKGGLEHFSELLLRFPNNVHILLEMAKVEATIGRNDESIINFEKARSMDPYVVTYMDEYAMLLKAKSDQSKLSRLIHDLLSIDPGQLVSVAEPTRCSSDSIQRSSRIKPDLRSYQGLVRSYLALSKVKEALYTAREAMKSMPQSAKALKIVGDVHASNVGGREKARKFYESALRLEPGFLGAALALAELHVVEGRNKDAVQLLERYLKDWADDSLHIKLAQVFAATNMLSEALSHYQAALRDIKFCNDGWLNFSSPVELFPRLYGSAALSEDRIADAFHAAEGLIWCPKLKEEGHLRR
ncbi:Anaphase-promoting complex subunit 7 [Acorus calamus]|uniref:Anaphase-promoting complex subunit 7 n=1 Tax=Acorus calamus TaxID=4465 RepID=A0AAV9EUK6_ACOCL|nr:Anaphase-promoting complex subunit 7 [Acorus calamus]